MASPEQKASNGQTSQSAAVVPKVELVSSGQDERNWRGIGIALIVIVIVCALIVTAVFLLSPDNEGPKVRNPRLNLMEVLDGSLIPRRFNGTWISEKELIYRAFDGTLILYNAETLNKTVLMLNTAFRLYDVHSYSLSADRKYVLLAYAIRKVSVPFRIFSKVGFETKFQDLEVEKLPPSPYLREALYSLSTDIE